MTLGIASFLAVRASDYSTIVARYQSYWPDQTVDEHSFYPFNAGQVVSSATGSQKTVTVSFAPSNTIIDLVEAGLTNGYFIELSFYYFDPPANGLPPTAKTLFANYIGELLNASQTEIDISVQVGSSLNPVEAQAPLRKFTTTLIGEPPKI